MHLATEYYVRSGIIKEMLGIPCSFFLTDLTTGEKKVVTIGHGYQMSDLVVKHWLIGSCSNEQVLPSIKEYLVPRHRLFDDEHVILERHQLLKYCEEPVPSRFNSNNHPMMADTYEFYVDNFFNTLSHRQRREDWLWNEFIRIYFPTLIRLTYNIFHYRSLEDASRDQRNIVSKHYPENWTYWMKWRKYLLDFKGVPAELIFSKEYNSYEED